MHPGTDGNAQCTGPRGGLDLRAGQCGADTAESPAAGAILPHPPEGESGLQHALGSQIPLLARAAGPRWRLGGVTGSQGELLTAPGRVKGVGIEGGLRTYGRELRVGSEGWVRRCPLGAA